MLSSLLKKSPAAVLVIGQSVIWAVLILWVLELLGSSRSLAY
jgi:hypothetical protein